MSGDNKASVLTPYIIPPGMRKGVNIGDGFILHAIERRIGAFAPGHCFTTREVPSAAARAVIAGSSALVIAGANQLTDDYSIWPGLRAEELAAGSLRVVPFGVGLYGRAERNQGFSANTEAILRLIHQRIEFSSWRCPRTVALLERLLPDLAGRFLMTGCPVLYDRPLLDGIRFHEGEDRIAVTITDQGDFLTRETRVLDFVARRFPSARRFLVLHQPMGQPKPLHRLVDVLPGLRHLGHPRPRLLRAARRLGFEIVLPGTAAAGIEFYRGMDLHIGSRLHAHLHMLSQNRRSFLVPVDGRSTGFADFLGFPLSRPDTLDRDMDFDFESLRSKARQHFGTMQAFTDSLKRQGIPA
ncbi:hypothetical protein [Zavarzinia sp.]|uniref:hypothetical protein n=1 Tax=Zavarzinia sp. TaxID=2027920 RepID=UPI003BB6C5ED